MLHNRQDLGIKRAIAAEPWLGIDGVPDLLTDGPNGMFKLVPLRNVWGAVRRRKLGWTNLRHQRPRLSEKSLDYASWIRIQRTRAEVPNENKLQRLVRPIA